MATRTRWRRGIGLVTTVWAGTSLVPLAPAAGQETGASNTLDEIVVTARRREESPQDIPISMVALGGGEVEQLGAQTLGDITAAVPNFTFQNRGSILGNFGMRGIVTSISNAGVESGMAVYVDGVLVGRPEAFDSALRDVAQVEVLRGPQGTFFGKNTIAGAVNIITRRPGDEFEADIKVETGRYDRAYVGGSINVPITDTLAGRLSLALEDQDGWIENLNDGRDFNGEDNFSGRLQLRFTPSMNLEVDWAADWFIDDRNFVAQVNDDPRDLKSNPNVDIDEGIVDIDSPSTSERAIWGSSLEFTYTTGGGYGLTLLTGFRKSDISSLVDGDTQRQALSDLKLDTVVENISQEFRIQSPANERFDWVAGANFSHQDIDNSTQTRFFPKNILAGCNAPVVPNTFRGFPPGPPFEATSTIAGFDAEGLPVWDFDLNNNGVANEPVVTIPPLGLFGADEAIGCHNPDLIAFGRHLAGGDALDQFVPLFDAGVTTADVPDIAQVREFGTLNNTAFALFAHGNYRSTDRLTLTLGIRHTWEDKELDMTQMGMINILRPSFVKQDDRHDNEFSGTVGLSFNLTDDVLAYANFSRGYKSGGFQFDITQGENASAFAPLFQGTAFVQSVLAQNPQAARADVIDAAIATSADPNAPPENVEFGPETANAYEIGFKSDLFSKRLRLNVAAFFTDYKDLQQNITRLATGIVVLNVPGAEISGFDVDFTALVTPRLTLRGGIGHADSKISDPLIIPNPQNPQVSLVDTSAFVGQRLAQAPDWTANLSAIYEHPLAGGATLLFRGDWSFTGEVLHELVEKGSPLEDIVTEDSYGLFNARIGYVSAKGDWDLFLWGRNIFDERYKAFRRANPIIRVFGLTPSGQGLAFPGSETAQAIAGPPAMWGISFSKRFTN